MRKSLLFSFVIFFSFSAPAQTGDDFYNINNLLTIYFSNGEYEKAIPIGEKAVEIAKKQFGENHPDYAMSLNNLAEIYRELAKYEKAIPLYIKAQEILSKAPGENRVKYAISLNNLALSYSAMAQYKKAEQLYIQSIEIRKKELGEDSPEYANSLNNLAELYQNTGEYKKAESLYVKTKEIQKKALGEWHPDYATTLTNLASLYILLGQYEKAEPLLIQSKDIRKKMLGEDHPDYANILNNLALLYEYMGQYEKAEPLLIQSKNIRKKMLGEDHPGYASSLNNLAGLYKDMGLYEKAEPLFIQSNEINKKSLGETHPDYCNSLNNLANLYEKTGDDEKAESLYILAMELTKKSAGETNIDYAKILNNLGMLYLSTVKYEKAESLFIKANKIYKQIVGETHQEYAAGLNNLALLYEATGRDKQAEILFIEAGAIQKKVFGETRLLNKEALSNLAALYEKRGDYERAGPLLLQTAEIDFRSLLNTFTILSGKEKNDYVNNQTSSLDLNNSFLYNYRKGFLPVLINNFNQHLAIKSLILSETKSIIDAVRNTKDTVVQNLFTQWQGQKIFLSKQYSLSGETRRPDLKKIEEDADNLEKLLSQKLSVFRNQQQSLQIKSAAVQKGLAANEAAIEFVSFRLYNKRWTDSIMYAAYVLRKSDSIPVFIPLCEEKQLQQLFDSAGKTTTGRVNKFYRGLDIKNNSPTSLGTALYKLVWSPLEPYLKGMKKVSYSPAGKLYNIAFHALPVDSNTLLSDKYTLRQYTSIRQVALRTGESQTTKPTGIILFGDANFSMDSLLLTKQRTNQTGTEGASTSIYTPQNRSSSSDVWNNLPGTAEEIKKIAELFTQNKLSTKSYMQTAASEENLKSLSGHSPQILHIATHGFFLPERNKKRKENNLNSENTYTLADDPLLRSGLILSGGNYAWSGKTPIDGVEDGIATAYEISQLNLSNTELVVLSACETALGDVKGSEGVFGLQRAFKMAGVKKMIVSLWQVPDKETAELMTAFYNYWMKGKTINDAFTQAQADMRKKYSPFYWAAFVLVE